VGRRTSAPPEFIVCAQPESRYAARMLARNGYTVRRGRVVNRDASRAIPPSSVRIVLGHGTDDGRELHLACGGARAKSLWLAADMPKPPRKARIYLYSCFCGRRLAVALAKSFVVGHYSQVPVPLAETRRVTLPFLRRVFELIGDRGVVTRPGMMRPLRRLASELVARETPQPGMALLAAVALSLSLYRR
jgi:hypothetical protein